MLTTLTLEVRQLKLTVVVKVVFLKFKSQDKRFVFDVIPFFSRSKSLETEQRWD